jgi:class 3 adenylate cyclase
MTFPPGRLRCQQIRTLRIAAGGNVDGIVAVAAFAAHAVFDYAGDNVNLTCRLEASAR